MKDLLFFLKLFTPYKTWLFMGVFLALLTMLASISLLTLSGWFITASAIAGVMAPDGIAITFNFMQPAAEIRALAMIRTFGRYAERVVTHEATFRVLAEIRCWFFEKLIPLSPGRIEQQRSSDLLNGMTQEINTLDALYIRLCSPILVALLGGGSVIAFISYYSAQIGVLILGMLLMTGVLIPWLFNQLGQEGSRKIVEQWAYFKINQIDILQGMAELQSFNAYKRYKTKLTSVSEEMLKTQEKNNQVIALSSSITLFFSQLALLITLVLGASLFQKGDISGAVFAMLSFCVLAAFELILPLSLALQLLPKMQTATKRIRRITHLKPTVVEPKKLLSMPICGDLEINNLRFRYSDELDWVLKNVNLTVPQGSKIAIVGKSGSGKTTLLQLLMRFYDPQQGSISYDETKYKYFSPYQLMSQFSVLSQRTQLFSASIKENLLIANPNASKLEIDEAIKLAGLERFIHRLPNGLDSWIGENGVKVSGGEGRRIALARVYLKKSTVLLLDEPTEGLDQETEDEILNALKKIIKDKTLIMVTHRKSSLALVDRVYTIDKGEICLTQ